MGAPGWVSAAILGGTSLLGGLLDDSDEQEIQAYRYKSELSSEASEEQTEAYRYAANLGYQSDIAKTLASLNIGKLGARRALPGQAEAAKNLQSYLFESLDEGLTEKERKLFRGAGKTNILQASEAAKKAASRGAAAQGLKGGAIANILAGIDQSTIPAMGKLETDIAALDAQTRRKAISDILALLGTPAGVTEEQLDAIDSNVKTSGDVIDVTPSKSVSVAPSKSVSKAKTISNVLSSEKSGEETLKDLQRKGIPYVVKNGILYKFDTDTGAKIPVSRISMDRYGGNRSVGPGGVDTSFGTGEHAGMSFGEALAFGLDVALSTGTSGVFGAMASMGGRAAGFKGPVTRGAEALGLIGGGDDNGGFGPTSGIGSIGGFGPGSASGGSYGGEGGGYGW